MTDEQLRDFSRLNHAAQRLMLRLEDMDVKRLDFEHWRVANGRNPEWAASSRRPVAWAEVDADA